MRDRLLAMLDGASHAAAAMPWGDPGPIRLPVDEAGRRRLAEAHLAGAPATVNFESEGKPSQTVRVERLVMSALCPAADGLVSWVGFDLDGLDHGPGGLVDPAHAARCIAERLDRFGLHDGLLAARSRRGVGRHLFLLLPRPVLLADAVLATARIIAEAYKVATEDVTEGIPHAFRTGTGAIASAGAAGAVELIPRSDARPRLGWPLTLPTPDRLLDPLDDDRQPDLTAPFRCSQAAWDRLIGEARGELEERRRMTPPPLRERRGLSQRALLERLHPRTHAFIEGRVAEGGRSNAAFAAACNLLGIGLDPATAERLILEGASRCGLGEREALGCFKSARKRVRS